MSNETYLNHPTFGLLYRVCIVEDRQELFATLYAQRLFFLVTTHDEGVQFEAVSRTEARVMVESRLRTLRRLGQHQAFQRLQLTHQNTFQ
ncbi:MAG: PipX family protein [Synechococcales bacterium]|nr:PipX family protein [Synechococcales bacterium]